MIKECFLNKECELLWEHEHFENSNSVTVALKASHICMDSEHYDESKLCRYEKTGYMYNINSLRNPDIVEVAHDSFGVI